MAARETSGRYGHWRIPGDEHDPALAELRKGELVLFVEVNGLQAQATLRTIELDGRSVWFAEIDDPNAIEVIYPGGAVRSRNTAQA